MEIRAFCSVGRPARMEMKYPKKQIRCQFLKLSKLKILVPMALVAFLLSTTQLKARGENSNLDAQGCFSDVAITDPSKLIASDREDGDQFGYSLDIAGEYIVIGNPLDDDLGMSSGSAYVFARSLDKTNEWTETKKLLNTLVPDLHYFGRSVAIDGSSIVVGAPTGGTSKGSAFIFEEDQGGIDNWGLVKQLIAPEVSESAAFGSSVDIDVDTIVIGAYADYDATNGEASGSVYIFERDAGGANNWGVVKRLTAYDGKPWDFFGRTVAIQGDTLFLGSVEEDSKGENAGAVYIFERNSGGANNWGNVKKITASDGNRNEYFGWSIDASGNTLLIGTYIDDANSFGKAYIFRRDHGGTGNWGEIATLKPKKTEETGNLFGNAVALEGSFSVIGARKDGYNGYQSGTTYLYKSSDNNQNWVFIGNLDASDGDMYDNFGNSISVDKKTLAVGAYQEDQDGLQAGAVYVYSYDFLCSVYLPVIVNTN
jgi:hypothetical protein